MRGQEHCATCADDGIVAAPFNLKLVEDGQTYVEFDAACVECEQGQRRAENLRERRWNQPGNPE